MNSLDSFYGYFDSNRQSLLQDFFEFLRFKSISTDPAMAGEVRGCANWLSAYLNNIGFDTEIWETGGHPIVYGSWLKAGADKPTVLIYNHYDVQPVDPIELWSSPPFEPVLKNGEVFARGAQDDKGQCFYVLHALKCLMERDGCLPLNVKVCVEGEEEIGSPNFHLELPKRKEKLRADSLLVVDLGLQEANSPAISLGCRGTVHLNVEVIGSDHDLHSGEYGGIVYNPIHALVELLAKLRDSSGKIAVPGFYDGVKPLTDKERSMISFEFNQSEFEKNNSTQATGGEREFSPLESAWIRPTLELNGICGGYTGPGAKTVIPAKASAKITCRLVPEQDPERVRQLLVAFLKRNAPQGVSLAFDDVCPGGSAVRTSAESGSCQAVASAYEAVMGKPCGYILCGGTISIAAELARTAEADVVFMGYGLPDDNIHSPNEHFGVNRLRQGVATIGLALEKLGSN